MALLAVMRQAMNSHADTRRNTEEARPREQAAAARPAEAEVRMALDANKALDAKMRADEDVWLRVIEAQRKAPEPSLEETLAKIRQTIAEDGV
jgi:hypothetical protein